MRFVQHLYTIITDNPLEKTIHLTDASHEVFKAHFPNNPILAGFLQVDLIETLFKLEIKKIKRLKFLHIIKPNVTLTFKKNNQTFTIFNENELKLSELIYE
ncbi:MAG: 3-hydroxyacyl-ACP dehydratase [Arcobacteraceae bacterium]